MVVSSVALGRPWKVRREYVTDTIAPLLPVQTSFKALSPNRDQKTSSLVVGVGPCASL